MTSKISRPRCLQDYSIAWFCILEEELDAAFVLLDNEHKNLDIPESIDDHFNVYKFGDVEGHNIVIVKPPSGRTGKVHMEQSISSFDKVFPHVKIYLLVGIGGGVPNTMYKKDIFLGDVVVGAPLGTGRPAVVEHDYGRQTTDGFVPLGRLLGPSNPLIAAVDEIQQNQTLRPPGHFFRSHLYKANRIVLADKGWHNGDEDKFRYPGCKLDVLFDAKYSHVKGNNPNCEKCDPNKIIRRRNLATTRPRTPRFHRGTIATGDKVIQDGEEREKLSIQSGGAICFEMEAAGILLSKSCLVIRGISDYSDSHKSPGYIWHNYAAGNAAAFAVEVIGTLRKPNALQRAPPKRASSVIPSL